MRSLIGLVLLASSEVSLAAAENSSDAARFEPVRKILSESCVGCHNAGQKKGGLDLSRRATSSARRQVR